MPLDICCLGGKLNKYLSVLSLQVDLNNGKAYSMIDVGQPILPDFVWEENPNQEVPHLYVAAKHEVISCSKL